MNLHRPLQVRILVHLVGPDRRVQFQPANNRDDFLPIRNAANFGNQRNGHALSRLEMFGPERSATVPADYRRQKLSSTGFSLCALSIKAAASRRAVTLAQPSVQPGILACTG